VLKFDTVDRQHLKGAAYGAVAGWLFATLLIVALVLLAPPNLNAGIPHPLLLILLAALPVLAGGALGWWQADIVTRYGSRIGDWFSARWIRFP